METKETMYNANPMHEIPYGYCHCGCNQKTNIAKKSDRKRNYIKGEPFKYLSGHNSKEQSHPNWKGGKTKTYNGYTLIHSSNHPNRHANNYVFEHVLVSEKALGKFLPSKAVVHHVNGNESDNRNENLVVCENDSYHKLLHQRQRAYEVCGHANWRKCEYCKQYGDPKHMYISLANRHARHRSCYNKYQKARKGK